jgi:hypothetical protein
MSRHRKKLRQARLILGLIFVGFILTVPWLRELTGARNNRELLEFLEDPGFLALLATMFIVPVTFIYWLFRKTRFGKNVKQIKDKKFKLNSNQRPLLEYWRQSVVDGNRRSISGKDIEEFGLNISIEEIRSGIPSPQVLQQIKSAIEVNKHQPRSGLEVLIAPTYLKRKKGADRSFGPSPYLIFPVWIPGTLDFKGQLQPLPNAVPWIPREFLEPLQQDTVITLGDIDSVDQFIKENPIPADISWKDYLKHCDRFFVYVAGERLSQLKLEDYEVIEESLLLPDVGILGNSKSIERLYTEILRSHFPSNLLGKIVSPRQASKRGKISSIVGIRSASLKHLGSLEYLNPLSPSQRKALHELLNLKSNEILPVTGPPGTGKTTLIHSVVSSLWVGSVITGQNYPPLIVACSSSNQATTNVINSFTKANTRPGPLAGRWLPDFTSYGLFCSSQTKARELTDELFTLLDGNGTLNEFENLSYVSEGKNFFLTKFSEAYFKTSSLKKATAHLKKEVKAIYSKLYSEIFSSLRGVTSEEEAFKKLEAFDTTLRHELFQIATHYWEGRWLMEISSLIGKREASQRPLRLNKSEWQIRAMITPCLVSNLSMAPQFFASAVNDNSTLDLLIFDEAGQVQSEIGAASLALTKKALVIGDTLQLEPVWQITPSADHGNLIRSKVAKEGDLKKVAEIESLGILSSKGSLMKLAIGYGSIKTDDKCLMLSEHRRSVPQIVAFSNSLCYENKLRCMRPELEKRILPALGYVNVDGKCESRGKSRENRIEAESIAAWILDNDFRLSTTYSLPLEKVIAVISPFTAQIRLLKELLEENFPEITVGTVNSLQGAEKPVVIFSSVYDEKYSGLMMFDQKPNLLNVAVSRAQDSFLVFGDMEIFQSKSNRPSAVLGNFLFNDPSNNLRKAK